MSDSKRQSLLVIGIAMIIISAILAYFALSQPKIYVDGSTASTAVENSSNVNIADTRSSLQSVTFPININTCDAEDLLSVDGIGESKAAAIVEYRDVIGEYTDLSQLKNIKGIGDNLFEKIAPYLCV